MHSDRVDWTRNLSDRIKMEYQIPTHTHAYQPATKLIKRPQIFTAIESKRGTRNSAVSHLIINQHLSTILFAFCMSARVCVSASSFEQRRGQPEKERCIKEMRNVSRPFIHSYTFLWYFYLIYIEHFAFHLFVLCVPFIRFIFVLFVSSFTIFFPLSLFIYFLRFSLFVVAAFRFWFSFAHFFFSASLGVSYSKRFSFAFRGHSFAYFCCCCFGSCFVHSCGVHLRFDIFPFASAGVFLRECSRPCTHSSFDHRT